MAKTQSFDVTSTIDMQEVDNALNQARKEVQQRYDFKGVHTEIELDRASGELRLVAGDEYKLQALISVVRERFSKRGVPLRNLRQGTIEPAAGGASRCIITLQQGIPTDTGREIVKLVKDMKLKKIQAQIQGDQLRITGPKRDELQEVMGVLKDQDFGIELQFGNYRGQ